MAYKYFRHNKQLIFFVIFYEPTFICRVVRNDSKPVLEHLQSFDVQRTSKDEHINPVTIEVIYGDVHKNLISGIYRPLHAIAINRYNFNAFLWPAIEHRTRLFGRVFNRSYLFNKLICDHRPWPRTGLDIKNINAIHTRCPLIMI